MARKSGDYYLKEAKRAGCNVRNGKGDHYFVTSPDGQHHTTIPRDLKGNGTEYSIIKFFKKIGILLTIFVLLYIVYIVNFGV